MGLENGLAEGADVTDETQARVNGADHEELMRLADGLLEQAGTVRRHYEQLTQTLDEASGSAASTLVPARSPVAAGPEQAPAGARVVALEMASAGESREATKAYLRESFGVDDSDSIVDEVYDLAGDREAELTRPPKRRFARRGR